MRHLCLAAAALTVAVSGCGGPSRVVEAPRSLSRPAVVAVPVPPRSPAMTMSDGENLWHLRAGLNVAALVCRGRGRPAVAPGYARVLIRHRALLSSAYAAEQGRHGSGTDRHLTRLYGNAPRKSSALMPRTSRQRQRRWIRPRWHAVPTHCWRG